MFDFERSPRMWSTNWTLRAMSPRLRLATRLYKSRQGCETGDIVNAALYMFLTEHAPDLLEQAATLLDVKWLRDGDQTAVIEANMHRATAGRARKKESS
jgi:hypothetical protein